MFADLMALKGLFKLDPVKNDNVVFRAHYKLTVVFLATFATIISLKQYVGDPIDCFVDGASGGITAVLDTYCWIHSTFTLPNQPGFKSNDGQMGVPGMGLPKEDEPVQQHKYYQWVGFFLMFQAVCFYLPRLAWKLREAGKLRQMIGDLRTAIMPSPIEEEAKRNLADYLFANLSHHNVYAFTFFICEALTFVNIIGQIYLLDTFLGGEFTTYGSNVLSQTGLDPEERIDPMSRVFPTISKCTFKNYGPSGTVQTFDAFCVLPVNIMNEKIFIFLWFWYIILSVCTGIAVLLRIVTIAVPKVRFRLLQKKVGSGIERDRAELVFRRCQIGDWYVLMLLSENMNQWVFQDVIDELADRMEGKTI